MALIRMYKKFDIWGIQVKKYFMAVYTVIFQLKQDWILRQNTAIIQERNVEPNIYLFLPHGY